MIHSHFRLKYRCDESFGFVLFLCFLIFIFFFTPDGETWLTTSRGIVRVPTPLLAAHGSDSGRTYLQMSPGSNFSLKHSKVYTKCNNAWPTVIMNNVFNLHTLKYKINILGKTFISAYFSSKLYIFFFM